MVVHKVSSICTNTTVKTDTRSRVSISLQSQMTGGTQYTTPHVVIAPQNTANEIYNLPLNNLWTPSSIQCCSAPPYYLYTVDIQGPSDQMQLRIRSRKELLTFPPPHSFGNWSGLWKQTSSQVIGSLTHQ